MYHSFSSISVVVPIFNEQDVVVELHRQLTAVLNQLKLPYEIIFIDDGSRDQSLEGLKSLQLSDSKVVLLELSRNYGQTAALAAGIDQACNQVIITMDGDLQHDPSEIPLLLAQLEQGYDVVSGCRKIRTDNLLLRKIPSRCANYLMRLVSGVPVQDFGSTFKCYRSVLLKQIELFGELHRFIPVLAARIGARIIEVPITVRPREKGSSNYGLGRTFGVLQDILFLEFYANYLTKPIRAFGKLFLLFFGAGFLIAATLLGLWFCGRIPAVIEHGALLLFSVFLMIIGVQFFVAGIFAELLTRIYLKTSGTKIYSVRKIYQAT